MANNTRIQIILSAVDAGVARTLAGVQSGLTSVNRSAQAYQKTLAGLSTTADGFRSTMVGVLAAVGGAGIFAQAARSASRFNSTIEQSQIGIAALVRNFTTLGDAPDGYAQSMQVASQIQKQLQIEGLKTTATYEQLLVALQEGIGPAFKAGFKPDEIVKFTSLMTQAAGAISLPMDQLGQELRAILDGTIDKNARVAKALGITNEKVKEMAASGQIFEYLKGQLAAFAQAGDDMGKSFTGAVSNVQDAVQMALGTAMQNSFSQTTAFMLRLKDAIVTIDDEAGTFTFNEKITSAFEQVDKALSDLLGKFSKEELAAMLASFVQAMGAVATAVLSFVGAISQVGVWLGPLAPMVAGAVTWFVLLAGSFKLVIGLPALLYRQVVALAAGFTTLTGLSLTAFFTKLRFQFSVTTLLATGFQKVMLGLSGVLAAFGVGWAIGTLLNKFTIVQKAGMHVAEALTVAFLRAKKAWAWVSGGDTAAVQREIDQARAIYGEMFADIDRGATKSAQAQKAAHEEVAVVAKTSAEKQVAALKSAWDAFENRLKSAQKQMALAASAAEVAAAEKALEFSRQGMEAAEAEKIARQDKLVLLDGEIARYVELRRLVPNAAPDGKDSGEARGELEQKINGLRTQRLGLLRDEVEAERKASADRLEQLKKETDAAHKLAAEKMRFASHERILALEEEKLEASKLPTALASAEAELAIERRISAEKIALKIAELAKLKKLEGVDPANIIQAEQALADQRAAFAAAELSGLRAVAAERQQTLERSWRAGSTSVAEYQAAVRESLRLRVIDQRQADELMIASGDNMSAALSLGWSRSMEKMKTDAEVMIEIGAMLPEQLAGGMTSAFDSFIEGSKTAKEAFMDFARSTLNMIAQIIMKQMILNALKSFGWGMADGGPVQKLASGGKVHGSSPNDRADNVPIWATAGEFMHPVRAVQKYGIGFMEAVRSLRFPADLARSMAMAAMPAPRFSLPASFHLASGGAVPRAPAAAANGGNSTNLQVINVLDQGLVGDYLSSAAGETTIINMIRRNGTTIKALLGG